MILLSCPILFALLLALAFYRHRTWKPLPWPKQAVHPEKFQAHRGYCQEGDEENTLASFHKAQVKGYGMIELDVHLSKDFIPIVFHDEDLQRLGQRSDLVKALTAQQMKELVHAPTLEDVLMSSAVPAKVNIEVKSKSFCGSVLEQKVCEVVKKCRAEDRVLFSSFNPLTLARLKKHLPQVPRALLASRERDPGNRIYLRELWLAPYVGVHLLHLDYRNYSLQELAGFRKRGIPVAFWTVNDEKKAQELLDSGALSIITDQIIN